MSQCDKAPAAAPSRCGNRVPSTFSYRSSSAQSIDYETESSEDPTEIIAIDSIIFIMQRKA